MKRLYIAGLVAVFLAVCVAAWFLLRSAPGSALGIDADDAALVAQGATLYARNCASCHGAKLEGQPDWQNRKPDGKLPAPPHDASGHSWHHSDRQLFDITKEGVAKFAGPGYQTDMPGFGSSLSDAEIAAIISFIKSSWPAKQRDVQAEISRQAAE